MTSNKIFVVLEDRFEDRFFLCRTIRESFPDAEIVEFAYSDEAFAFLKDLSNVENVVVFVDVMLPGIDGREFIDLCFSELYQSTAAAPKFVAVSGVVDGPGKELIETDGRVAAFLPKPVVRAELESLVAS